MLKGHDFLNYESYRTSMRSDFIEGMKPAGQWEFPTIYRTNACPSSLIPFDKAVPSKDHSGWVHFFIHDSRFTQLLNNPWRYLPILAKFDGALSPDYSVFWDIHSTGS